MEGSEGKNICMSRISSSAAFSEEEKGEEEQEEAQDKGEEL